ncbi:hypothetical protein MVES1_001182 [Malassezia vespertilionis]|uniref:uncharacterized protein n=1 Tax=Malassezia vespertilionis TaxID=2020962 RepID=UPI0024B07400|nr:uncharacterized protein MVES1_001182 [Malassezia vespertilionis]WFD05848.1 hypothetical protein MVES1_001182 [Malassezia vespertilionis]
MADVVEHAASAGTENVRLERMREALSKFLEFIDLKAKYVVHTAHRSAKNFAVSLPDLDEVALEKVRLLFVQDLKSEIRNDLEQLVTKYDLRARLDELELLTSEADERQKRDYAPHASELKDVWRPDLDISTAIRARVATEQESRIAALEEELAELYASNAESYARIEASEAHIHAAQEQVSVSCAMLDKLLASVALSDQGNGRSVHTMMDALITELGPA